jgi:cyanate permease
VLVMAGLLAAAIFGCVTVNETMMARYVAPALRVKLYSVRFFVGFLGAAAASPAVALLHERTGGQDAVLLVLAGVAVLTAICTLAFPNRKEELQPELWALAAPPPRGVPATPAE